MSEIAALGAISAAIEPAAALPAPSTPMSAAPSVGFADLLANGFQTMDAKVAHADRMVERFALDDNVPLHQVTIALEEARLSVEFAMQVRQRLVEGYKELMNMQL